MEDVDWSAHARQLRSEHLFTDDVTDLMREVRRDVTACRHADASRCLVSGGATSFTDKILIIVCMWKTTRVESLTTARNRKKTSLSRSEKQDV